MTIQPRSEPARILLSEADDASRLFLADEITADGFTVDAVTDDRAVLVNRRPRVRAP